MIGWLIALVGILLVVANPVVGIGFFVLGIIIAIGASSPSKTSTEAKAFGTVLGLVFGGLFVLLGVSAAVGVIGALF